MLRKNARALMAKVTDDKKEIDSNAIRYAVR